jgi:hypothetical protein
MPLGRWRFAAIERRTHRDGHTDVDGDHESQ